MYTDFSPLNVTSVTKNLPWIGSRDHTAQFWRTESRISFLRIAPVYDGALCPLLLMADRSLRILVVSSHPYDSAPGLRFRIEQWARFLPEFGLECEFDTFGTAGLRELIGVPGRRIAKLRAFGRSWRERRRRLQRRDYDLVFVYQEAAPFGPPLLERWLERERVPFVLDFDDAIFLRAADQKFSLGEVLRLRGLGAAAKWQGKMATLCRLATHVTAGNDYLASYARRFTDRVTVVPTTIDLSVYRTAEKATDGPIVIGWSGSISTAFYVQMLNEVLADLAREQSFRFLVIGGGHHSIPGVDVETIPWRPQSEVEDLRRIDIGVMPLRDDPWSRGKCGLKALQYMALAVPTVCSSVGVNSDIIVDGENGMLASTPGEWKEKLRLLLSDASMRRRLGSAGRLTVEKSYSAAVHVPRFAELLKRCVEERR
jgi:glycosyltransferase involved in cell wall biosynthesis